MSVMPTMAPGSMSSHRGRSISRLETQRAHKMLDLTGIALLVVGVLGIIYQCVIFIMETLPANYGNNPGFGALESMLIPWFIAMGIGLGILMKSWIWGVTIPAIFLFFFGFLAMFLSQLFRGRK